MAQGKISPQKPPQKNYGRIAELRVDAALARLQNEGIIHFWFRADSKIDAEGVDHIFGLLRPKLLAWVLQVSSGRVKRRTYHRKVFFIGALSFKKPYYRRRYHRYIPLLAVTPKIADATVQRKIIRMSRTFPSILENSRCPKRLKELLGDLLLAKGLLFPNEF